VRAYSSTARNRSARAYELLAALAARSIMIALMASTIVLAPVAGTMVFARLAKSARTR
jgi:hypothetical protein